MHAAVIESELWETRGMSAIQQQAAAMASPLAMAPCPRRAARFLAARRSPLHRGAWAPRKRRGGPPPPAAASAPPTPPPADPAAVSSRPKRLAVFVSGGGSNFRAIHAYIQRERLNAEVAVVVSNAPSCAAVEYAQEHGVPTLTFPAPKANPAAGLTAEQLLQDLQEVRVGWVVRWSPLGACWGQH